MSANPTVLQLVIRPVVQEGGSHYYQISRFFMRMDSAKAWAETYAMGKPLVWTDSGPLDSKAVKNKLSYTIAPIIIYDNEDSSVS